MFGDKKSLKDSERSLISETVSIDGTVNSSGAIDVAGLVKGPVYSKEIVIKDMIAPLLIGKKIQEPSDIKKIIKELQFKLHTFGRYGITIFACSGVEIGLWDALGKEKNKPIYKMLGNTNKKKFCSHLNYISQDVAQYSGTDTSGGLHTGEIDYSNLDIVSDITDIPLEKESLDVILCVEVIEHLENPLLAFQEFSRLLKNGGKLILTAPLIL